MEKNEIVEQLRKKLDRNMDMFQKEWWQKSPSVLVGMAKEIAATQTVYNELYGGSYPSGHLEYLLRFANPLEVVRDQWLEEQSLPVLDEEMSHALWNIADKQSAELEYELDEDYKPPGMEQGVSMC